MATLYRKYRPQKFSEVFGQNHIKMTLEHEIDSGKIAHAYLFCGPRGNGKTTMARILAKAVNCTNRKQGEHEPCNICDSCKDITIGRSMDIIEIDAASHTGVDNVRENIIAAARVAPSRSKYKVFIIDEVHMLSTSAFNALLKNIEEPPEYVIFILCTTEVHKVPTTIISRCQRFDFKKANVSDIIKKLQFVTKEEGVKVDRKILEAIARQSEGHVRDAESLLGQVIAIGGKEITEEEANLVIPRSDLGEAIKLIDCLGKKDAGSAIALINKLVDEGVDLKSFLSDLIELLRKIMLTKVNPSLSEKLGLELGEDLELKINEVSQNISLNQSVAFIEKFLEARNELKGSFIIQLPIEVAIAELCIVPAKPIMPAGSQSFQNPPVVSSGGYRPISTNYPTNNAAVKKEDMPTGAVNISKESVLAKWNEVLAVVKKYNHSLSFILRACQPREINGNKLLLAFKYKFHKDRIGENSIRILVEKVLLEVYGQPIMVEALIDETIEVNNESTSYKNDIAEGTDKQAETAGSKKESSDESGENMINNLLKTFGGKIVK